MSLSRRTILRLAGAAVVPATGGAVSAPSAFAANPSISGNVEDLGPGNYAYPLMSGLLAGDTFFIGSRNLTPTRALAYHVPTRSVTRSVRFGPGNFVQALAHHQGVVYAGITGAKDGDPKIWKWDLATNAASPMAAIDGFDVRALDVAPDGMLYAVGKEADPGIHEIDPVSGTHRVLAVPAPGATQARGLSVTDRHVFFGAGSNLAGGGGASSATVHVVDRATAAVRSILPAEIAVDPATRDLAVIGERLYVGTEGGTEKGWFAVFSLTDYALEFAVRTRAKTCKDFVEAEGQIYFDADGLCRYDPVNRVYQELPGAETVGGWGLGYLDGTIVAANQEQQSVVHFQLADGAISSVDLIGAGAPGGPQLGMSVASDRFHTYVGGNSSVDLHDLTRDTVTKLAFPGECKDMLTIGGTLIAAVYNSQGIWSYDPHRAAAPARLISLPQEQNRPQDMVYDSSSRRLLVSIQSDTLGGGSLAVCDLHRRTAKVYPNSLPDLQFGRSLTTADGLAYLGGDNAHRDRAKGHLACLAVGDGTPLWTFDPGFGQGISGLVAVRGRLIGLTGRGILFVVDPHTRTVTHTADVRPLAPGNGRLVVSHGQVYGGSAAAVFHVDPGTYTVTPLVTGLDGDWYSGPRIAADASGALYTLKGRNLIRVTPSRC